MAGSSKRAMGPVLTWSYVLHVGLAALILLWGIRFMAEESKAAVMRVPSLLLDAIGATLLIVGGEIAGHGIAYGEGGRIIGIGSVIFLFGLASIAAGIFWSR